MLTDADNKIYFHFQGQFFFHTGDKLQSKVGSISSSVIQLRNLFFKFTCLLTWAFQVHEH